MLNRLPRQLPALSLMLDDIGAPSADQVAKALQVSVHQVRAWRRLDQAPHTAMLAIFWLTQWGMSLVECEAINVANLHMGMASALTREVETLRAELARVISLGDFGCANAPTLADAAPRLRVVHSR